MDNELPSARHDAAGEHPSAWRLTRLEAANEGRRTLARIKEIAVRGRLDPPLSLEELTQKIREIAERDRVGPRLMPDEVMRRVAQIAGSGRSVDETPTQVPAAERAAAEALEKAQVLGPTVDIVSLSN